MGYLLNIPAKKRKNVDIEYGLRRGDKYDATFEKYHQYGGIGAFHDNG